MITGNVEELKKGQMGRWIVDRKSMGTSMGQRAQSRPDKGVPCTYRLKDMTTKAKPRRRRMRRQESERRCNKSESKEKRSASAFKQKDYSIVQRTVKRRRRWMGDDAALGSPCPLWKGGGPGREAEVGITIEHGPRGDFQLAQGEDVLSSRRM